MVGAPSSAALPARVLFRVTGASTVGKAVRELAREDGIDFDAMNAALAVAVNQGGGRTLLCPVRVPVGLLAGGGTLALMFGADLPAHVLPPAAAAPAGAAPLAAAPLAGPQWTLRDAWADIDAGAALVVPRFLRNVRHCACGW